MGAVPRKAEVFASYTQDFDCDRRCQVEIDLVDIHVRFTLGMMIAKAEVAHKQAHKAAEATFRADTATIVRAGVLAVAA